MFHIFSIILYNAVIQKQESTGLVDDLKEEPTIRLQIKVGILICYQIHNIL